MVFLDYGECCPTEQADCTRNEVYRLLEYCDNRHGAGELPCEGKSKFGSNKEKWQNDAYMKYLGQSDIFQFLVDYYNKKSKQVVGSEDPENVISYDSVERSESWRYKQLVPKYSISRIYEKVQTCGNVEITPKPVFAATFTSTTYCAPYDYWEYLDGQDCDNRNNEFNVKHWTIAFQFGSEVKKYKSSLLYRLNLTISSLVRGLDFNFGQELSPSNVTKQYWNQMNESLWDLKVKATQQVTTQPQYMTKYYQLLGRCAEYKIYTNIIKAVKIPGLKFCKRHDEYLFAGRYELAENSGTLASINYNYYIHPIGIDFYNREEDVKQLKLNHVYDELCLEARRKFNISDVALIKGEHITNVEKWIDYSKRYTKCPWRLTDLDEGCGIKLKQVYIVESAGNFSASQLVGSCGEVIVYTDYIHKYTGGV